MVTLAQMQADPYYRREIVPPALTGLGDEMCRRTGRPRDAAGDRGDRFHLSGAHRSQRFIVNSALSTSRTYTVQSGLTAAQLDWIAGFDFTPGNVEDMIDQSRRLVGAMKAGRLDEVLAIYCNVDGDQVVDGWDNVRDRAASSDSSHLWHWHLTIDRRYANDPALMARIVAIALGEDDDMDLTTQIPGVGSYNNYLVTTWGRLGEVYKTVPLLVGAVTAIGTAVGQIDERVAEQLAGPLGELAAAAEATRTEVGQVDEAVIEGLSGRADDEIREALVAALGEARLQRIAAGVGAPDQD
jgi:hypothetical protein